MLYDGNVIAKETNVISIADSEETLMIEEESRSKILLKQSDLMVLETQELPKVSLVNTSLKKLKYHLGKFDNVVKKRITPNALTKGEWRFEHTKAVFQNEIIPFLETLKDIFNVFDKDLLIEATELQTVFNQMEAAVQQYHVEKQYIVNIVVTSLLDENTLVNVNSFVAMNDSVNYVEM
ncbi:putative reverse transcriptase domain-containing protein [Tanacetum coccineum]